MNEAKLNNQYVVVGISSPLRTDSPSHQHTKRALKFK